MLLKTNDLKYALNVAKKAISKGNSGSKIREIIHFECKDKVLTIAGLDGIRANFLQLNVDTDEEYSFNVEPFDIPKYAGETVVISRVGNKILFDFDTILIRKENVELSTEYIKLEKILHDKEPVFKIAFNPKYIKDALSVTPRHNDCVVFEFYGPLTPAIIKIDDLSLASDTRLVFPIRHSETENWGVKCESQQ